MYVFTSFLFVCTLYHSQIYIFFKNNYQNYIDKTRKRYIAWKEFNLLKLQKTLPLHYKNKLFDL